MPSNAKALVTGVAGFIGSNLARELLRRGYEVVGLDNLCHGFIRNVAPLMGDPRFRFVRGDVRDRACVRDAARGARFIVQLAALKIPRYGSALDTLLVNSQGTQNVLEAAREFGCKVALASTSDVYGKNPELPFREDSALVMGSPTIKRWSYAVSKLFDEHLCLAYHAEHGVPVAIMRYFGSYGPNQNLTWWGGPQSVFISAALADRPMLIHGDGQQTRSFTYVSDTVAGTLLCLEKPESVGEVLNIGQTTEITILDLARLVWRLAGRGEPKLEFVPYSTFGKYEDVPRRVPDISKARRLLGFEPRVGLEEGLSLTIAWQRDILSREKAT
ncbi:MAG: NAD-dependent epimerase/dehydratase family protein [Planctomycetes bacterium]|nr:NAD-dependent epimerase/dehydratase family protein [Planctomycetota bacterium]